MKKKKIIKVNKMLINILILKMKTGCLQLDTVTSDLNVSQEAQF